MLDALHVGRSRFRKKTGALLRKMFNLFADEQVSQAKAGKSRELIRYGRWWRGIQEQLPGTF
jgi:hypothetical protein